MLALMTALLLSQSGPLLGPAEAFPGDGAHAEGAQGVHDPTVFQVGDTFYAFCTSGNGFSVLRTSRDLLRWKVWGPVLPETPEWLRKRIPQHRSLWAPDCIRVGRALRMYYCASERFGGNGSVIGFAENPDPNPEKPLQGWVDRGMVLESVQGVDTFNAIDPEVLVLPNGRQFLFFGSYFAGLYVQELDPKTGKLKHPDHSDRTLVARNTMDRGNALEAAAVIQRDGWTYLFVSYGLAAQGVRSTYRIVVGRSKSPTGPFVDSNGVPMVDGGHTVVLRGSPPMFAPGHCDLLRASDGRWLMPYHFYDGREHWHGDVWGLPTLQIRELLWSEDGWPLPGLPVEWVGRPKGGAPGVEGVWLHQADFGRVLRVRLEPGGVLREGDRTGRWTRSGDRLTLEWPKPEGGYWTDTVRLAYDGWYYVGRNDAGMVIRGFREP